MADNSDQENISSEDEDKDFAVVTSANNFESSQDDIENGVTAEPANKLAVSNSFAWKFVFGKMRKSY